VLLALQREINHPAAVGTEGVDALWHPHIAPVLPVWDCAEC